MSRKKPLPNPRSTAQSRRSASVARIPSNPAISIALPLIILAVVLFAFWPALSAQFVSYDDDRLFINNPSYRGLTPANLRWMFTTTFMGHYQPFTWISHAIDYSFSGNSPTAYHVNNLILHALNALLVYFLCLRLLPLAANRPSDANRPALQFASAVAALLFAVHPLRVESVAWATERRDLLSGFFLLLSLLAYLRAFPSASTRLMSPPAFVASCFLLLVSLLAKAWGMTFAFVLLILDIYPLRRLPPRPTAWFAPPHRVVILQKIPYLLLGLAAAAMAAFAQHSALDTMATLQSWGLPERLIQATYGLAYYIWKSFAPFNLCPLVERPNHLFPLDAHFIVAAVAVPLTAAALLLLRRRLPGLLAAAAVYIIIVLPVLGLLQSGPQLVADRYTYLGTIGLACLAGGALWRFLAPPSPPRMTIALAVSAALIVSLALFARRQTRVWHDSRSLWSSVLAVAPSSAAHLNYGILERQDGRLDDAIAHYRQALALHPDNGDAWYALGNALKQQRDYPAAVDAFTRGLPCMVQKHRAWLNLGNTYREMHRPADAIVAYRRAVEHVEANREKMFSPAPYLALGIALREQGDLDESRRMLEIAARYRETAARAQQILSGK